MFGRSKESQAKPREVDDQELSKMFFDSFSKRVSFVEEHLRMLGTELEALKVAKDRSQLSDLVLLERLQRTEDILVESLGWIKKLAARTELTAMRSGDDVRITTELESQVAPQPRVISSVPMQNFVMPGGESGSLSSITTPTEFQVLALLAEQGAKSAPEIGRVIGRSREHSARLMKKLFQEGYVRRDQARIPFRYSLVERVRASFKKPEQTEEKHQEEAASVQA
jgi:DNA-binding MarR family transcriptional regulator